MAPVAPAHGRRTRSLLWRVALVNAAVFSAAILTLALSPATVSQPIAGDEAIVLAAGTVLVVLANLLALRGAFAPLVRLASKMATIDPLAPGVRVPEPSAHREIVAVARAFNQMAERLEHERRDSARRALHAEEAERLRIAQDLHDQIGQSLTFLLIQLSRARSREEVIEAQETARAILEDARAISQRLRPESLDDLGIVVALESLAARVREAGAVEVVTELDRDLPELPEDAQLALVRVAQEALTNVLRHARATTAVVSLRATEAGLRLEVDDDGLGLRTEVGDGDGIRGMRERALSIGASLAVTDRACGGTRVALELELVGVPA